MQRLTGLDASFLQLETPSSHMHVASLGIFDPSEVEGGVSLESVIKIYEGRLHLAPPFRRRLAHVPFGLHHPIWIEDPDFDIHNHVRHTAIPAPGGTRELSNLVSRLVALPLDRIAAAVGDLAHRGPRGRQRRPAHQGPPRRHRRRVGQRAARRSARPVARGGRARPRDRVAARPRAERRRAARLRRHLAGPPAAARRQGDGAHGQRRARRPPARPGVAARRACRRRRSPRRARRSTPRSRRAAATRSRRSTCRR